MPSVPLLALICPTSPGCPRCLCSLLTSLKTFLHRRVSQVKNGKSTQHRLTQSPTFHFLRRDPKDVQYLDHNINKYARHSRSRGDPSVNLKPLEESFDPVKELDKIVSASTDILGCLRVKVLE